MSTWISRALLLGAVSGLAGCMSGGFATRSAPVAMAVADNSVIVAGPPGFCVDPRVSRDGAKAFVLLGSCASIANDPDRPKPEVPGLVTVVVSSDPATYTDVDSSLDLLETYFRSPEGRAVLSRRGDPSTVTVRQIRRQDGVLFVQASDSAGGPVDGADDTWWRALLDVNGRLVTVSVVGFEGRPMSADAGLAAAQATTARIRAASRNPAG